jgi:hypothetical protein
VADRAHSLAAELLAAADRAGPSSVLASSLRKANGA